MEDHLQKLVSSTGRYFDSLDTWNRYEMQIVNSLFSLGSHAETRENKKLCFLHGKPRTEFACDSTWPPSECKSCRSMGTKINMRTRTYVVIASIGDCLNPPYWLIPFCFVKMSLFEYDYLHLFWLNFVFHNIGLVFWTVVVLLPSWKVCLRKQWSGRVIRKWCGVFYCHVQ